MTLCQKCGAFVTYVETTLPFTCPTCIGTLYIDTDPPSPQPPSTLTVYIPPCEACKAKDAEIVRLKALVQRAYQAGHEHGFESGEMSERDIRWPEGYPSFVEAWQAFAQREGLR